MSDLLGRFISQWSVWCREIPHVPSDAAAGRGLRAGEWSEWRYDEESDYAYLRGRHCEITLTPRAPHCDRGRVYAQLWVWADPKDFSVDYQDGWFPGRYYFHLDNAREEIEAWMETRREWVQRPAAADGTATEAAS